MLLNYLKIALRSLWKNKVFSLINVLGLGMSLSIATVIYLIIDYHYSFDDFHPDQQRIYRVVTSSIIDGLEFRNPGVSVPLFDVLDKEVSGIDIAAPFVKLYSHILVQQDNQEVKFKDENKIIFTDDRYFSILNYSWIVGSKESLTQPHTVVLTKSVADKFYGEQNNYETILGKEILVNDSVNLEITGIVNDLQKPTEFIFNTFVSLPTFYSLQFNFYKGWKGVSSENQLLTKLQKDIEIDQVESQFPGLLSKHLNKKEVTRTQSLQPLGELHFNSSYPNLSGISMVKFKLYGLAFIALFLVLLACFNFINLTTSTEISKLKELTVRKSLGGNKQYLVLQQIVETLVIFILAAGVCFILAMFVFQGFGEFIPRDLTFKSIWTINSIVLIICSVFLLALFTGIFPALSLIKTSLENTSSYKGRSNRLANRVLVISQFSITLFLIIATLIIYKQTRFSINKDLGFNPQGVITFRAKETDKDLDLYNQLIRIPEIEKVSLSCDPPLSLSSRSQVFKYESGSEMIEILAEHKDADQAYTEIYQFDIIAGSNLGHRKDKECLINQRFLLEMGASYPTDVLGSLLLDDEDNELTVVGVVKDFHFQKTHYPIEPLMIKSDPGSSRYFHVKTSNDNHETINQVIEKSEAAWNNFYPDEPFNYSFLDNRIESFYSSEKNNSLFLFWASLCTIFLSCMGILGLAIFSTNQKIKEIGIRKVNGAKVSEILMLLNKDFVKWVVIAFIIATPIAWYAMNQWLENFAYKTELSWWVFALAGLLALGVALLTVSWQSWKAATSNPVEALRYE